MKSFKQSTSLVIAVLVILFTGNVLAQYALSTAEENDQYNQEGVDKWNRMATLYARERQGEKSGWKRGQELYYMRCWFCHSELVTVGDPFPAPSLRTIGRFDGEYIKAMLRAGSAGMPTYLPENLSNKDIEDLVAYLGQKCNTFETGSGCFDEHNPPANPLYKY